MDEKCVCTCTRTIDLHPDVNLKRTGIEIDDNNSSQCRVQFNVSVSDSIHMYIDMYLHNKPMFMHIHVYCILNCIHVCVVYIHVHYQPLKIVLRGPGLF